MSVVLPSSLAETDAASVVRWAAQLFGEGAVLTSSFEDPVMVHLIAQHAPQIPVVFLDTQYHFAETLWYAHTLQELLGFDLRIVGPREDVEPDDQWRTDVEGCCQRRKVEPLERTLKDKAAWITGVRRADSATRANLPVVFNDVIRDVVKINPIVAWSDEMVSAYINEHDLPVNPLTERGYPSVGCWPCTTPVRPGEDPRSGRWAGSEKTECGLHR